MRILVTGGAGYIGSHTCLELLGAGHEVTVVDNLSNSSEVSLQRVRELSGAGAGKNLRFHKLDLRDAAALSRVFRESRSEAVIHFAGLKAVGESSQKPLEYYDNNVNGTLVLLECMRTSGVKTLVFSSSATVYGEAKTMPLREDAALSATNPYGRTKLMIEEILRDLSASDPAWRIALLRYFNPVGAHGSGRIGEDPRGTPNNLVPFVAQVAVGRREEVSIFGNDYPTADGTGVRDYIHVVDLARGHLAALDGLKRRAGSHAWNLGTGKGHSVLEVLAAFGKAAGRKIPYKVVARRPGDVATSYADPAKALRDLGWKSEKTLDQMCADAWRWQSGNPEGYPSQPS